jgi:hypothetical protein
VTRETADVSQVAACWSVVKARRVVRDVATVMSDRRKGQPPAGHPVSVRLCLIAMHASDDRNVRTMALKTRPPKSGRTFARQMRISPLFRRAMTLDIALVTIFIIRALTFKTQASLSARSARADAAVAAAGLSLAVVALRQDARMPVVAGLLLNTTGCVVTLMRHARNEPRRAPWSWTAYLLVGGNAVGLAYLAAGGGTDRHR